MTKQRRIIIAGINGRLAKASAQAIIASGDCELVGGFGRKDADYVGDEIPGTEIPIAADFESIDAEADILLELSSHYSAMNHAKAAIERGMRFVIGTSGLSSKDISELSTLVKKKNTGSMIVPNFSIGAVLMMEFAKTAAKHFQNVEIVETHQPHKLDAPSGTASHTLRKIAENKMEYNPKVVDEKELMPGARGACHESGVRVHSLRLPGLISRQEVIFGSRGELLTINHDSFNTDCFIKGILLSLRTVQSLDGLVVGLETLL